MLDFTWKVFCMTGNVDTYLLYKEVENEKSQEIEEEEPQNEQPMH